MGAISCLTKILVNCPDDILFEKLDEITDNDLFGKSGKVWTRNEMIGINLQLLWNNMSLCFQLS